MGRSKKILLVDDEEIIRDALGGLLMEEGYEVVEAENGNVAIDKLSTDRFDIVITDVKMPGKSGIDVLTAAKMIDPKIDVIMITGFTTEEPDQALSLGAKDFIYKSYNVEEFLAKIKDAIERID
ncbi:MAG: response regulator [Proteobacteria bacterium]|nr:response regulator [Pseudomonadota bacterium]NIS68157.1 response regulator [Pseudomonadota bacterium]